jgi:hypothetical protein
VSLLKPLAGLVGPLEIMFSGDNLSTLFPFAQTHPVCEAEEKE